MIGEKNLKCVMDVLLNDELYFALHSLLERFNNFRAEHINSTGYDGLNNIISKHGLMDSETWRDALYIRTTQPNAGSVGSVLELRQYVTNHPENTLVSNRMEIEGYARATDISPIRTIVSSNVSDSVGWYLVDNYVTDDVEAELFQLNTIHEVYSTYELQEIMNRAMNLPLLQNDHLTILEGMVYHDAYKHMNNILRGY